MALKLDSKLRIGVITIHRRTEPAAGPWQPSIDEMRELVEPVDRSGYDSLGAAITSPFRPPSSIRSCSWLRPPSSAAA